MDTEGGKKSLSQSFIFVVENLRIGGIQRLVLDECYQLIEWGHTPTIISLSPHLQGDSMLEIDTGYPLVKKVNVIYLNQSKLVHFRYFFKLIGGSSKEKLLISHSASATPVIRIASIFLGKRIKVTLFIHQLLALSDTKQKLKRFIYSLFANEIAFSSNQFLLDWQHEINKLPALRILFLKKMSFDRMGVYLPRLRWGTLNGEKICDLNVPHLVFMSRISSWKGSNTYVEICNRNLNAELHSIAFISRNNRIELFNPNDFRSAESHVVYEKGLTNVSLDPRSVHIYPSNYGPKIRFPQSIGMNVLEMLARGIPSLISPEGFESWPEFKNSSLVTIVNWSNPSAVDSAIADALDVTIKDRLAETVRLTSIISIERHVERIIERV